ncbi:MAG: DUF4956 domain-containing protein [Bacteroidales bacterium]|nr:DUF4956 domain-containing protein [Bacteroidales bacterium]
MEFLGIPFFDDDFFKMIFRLAINMVFLTIIIRFLYYRSTKKPEYIFTYYMIGLVVFFICFTLKKFELELGMALGLFAIFGIIRYRTEAVDTKEMTYLFIVIGVSVINALANKKMSYAEIFAANLIVIIAIYIIERVLFKNKERSLEMTYEKIENVHFENKELIIADLKLRLGINVTHFDIHSVDYLRDTARLTVFYKL